MKKRFTALVCVAAMAVCMLASCGASSKDFSAAGMTITLTNAFTEKELASATSYYESTTSIVLTLKEEFSLFEQNGISTDISLKEYAELIAYNNGFDVEIIENDGLTYFTYENTANGKDFTYLATVHKCSDAFWLIQFACESKNYEKLSKDFMTWAKSVKFE